MIAALADPTVSRRDLLKGGALVVGFSFAGMALPSSVAAAPLIVMPL